MLAVVAGTTTLLAGLAGSERVAGWVERHAEARARQTHTAFWNDGYFIDAEDRLLNEELPAADYSRGGVYFIGASNMRSATDFADLPPDQRALIHNYAISQSNHLHKFQFLRFLVEHHNLLQAGGEKNLVAFALNVGETAFKYNPDGYFVRLFQRHGFYTCTRENGIQPTDMPEWRRKLHLQRVRIAGLLTKSVDTMRYILHGRHRLRPINPDRVGMNAERVAELRRGNWEQEIKEQLAIFAAMVDYLRERKVRVEFILLPYGSWSQGGYFEAAYSERVREIAAERGIKVHDWTTRLADEEFQDSGHPGIAGADRLEPDFLEVAVPFLRSTGALR